MSALLPASLARAGSRCSVLVNLTKLSVLAKKKKKKRKLKEIALLQFAYRAGHVGRLFSRLPLDRR
jgi:hypothetical protein